MTKKLYKSQKNKMLLGVCAGIAEYFEKDVLLIRILFVILTFFHGIGFLAYIGAAIFLPTDKSSGDEKKSEETAAESAQENTAQSSKTPHSDDEFHDFFKS